MEVLTGVFSRLLSMALVALPVTAVVLAARFALGKAPKKYSCALWCAVWFRLACPVSVERLWSIFNLPGLRRVAETTGAVGYGTVKSPLPAVTVPLRPVQTFPPEAVQITPPPAETAVPLGELALKAAAVVWLLVVLALLVWGAVRMLRLRRELADAVWNGGEVWESGRVPTPLVVGLFRPRIYIPFGLDDDQRTYVLAHERYHIRRRDPLWKLLAWVLLTVYWWNPAVWLSWALFCRDLEMSCDEAVLSQLGDQVKKGYSLSLVSFAADRRFPAALAFGEHDASRRVRNILRWKRETPRAAFLAVAAVMLVIAACCSNGEENAESWVKNGEEPGTIRCHLAQNVREETLYLDTYEYGRLVSSEPLCGVKSPDLIRDGSITISCEPMWKPGGAYDTIRLRVELPDVGVVEKDVALGEAYSCLGTVCVNDTRTVIAPVEGSLLFYAHASSDSRVFADPMDNDWTVQVRLVLDEAYEGAGALPLDLAQRLYELRTDSTQMDAERIRAVLQALGVSEAGSYDLITSAPGEERVVLVRFTDIPANQALIEEKMWPAGYLLPALMGAVDRVDYSWPSADGAENTTVYGPGGGSCAKTLGYSSLWDLGASPAGIRALLAYLGAEEMDTAATNTARQIYELAQDSTPEDLVDDLLCWDLWGMPELDGTYTWTVRDGVLLVTVADGGLFQQAMADDLLRKNAALLLALRPELSEVRINCGARYLRMTADNASRLLPEGRPIRKYGASPEMVQQLIALLERGGVSETAKLLRSFRGTGQLDLEETLLSMRDTERETGLLDDWRPRNHVNIRHHDPARMALTFDDPQMDLTAMDRAMTKNALAILALRPEVSEVNWSYSPEDYQRTFTEDDAARWLASAGASDQNIRVYGESDAGMQALLDLMAARIVSRVTGETPTGAVPYPAHGGAVAQYAYDLAPDVETVGLWTTLYRDGVPVADAPIWQTAPGAEDFPRQGRFWLRYTLRDAAGGWDQVDWDVLSWGKKDEEIETLGGAYFRLHAAFGQNGRTEAALEGTSALETGDGTAVLFAACFGGETDPEIVPAAALNDVQTLREIIAKNEVTAVVWLSVSTQAETLTRPATGLAAEPFADILGYDGMLVTDTSPNGFQCRTYYAGDGSLFPIARSYGYESRGAGADTAVDLDGDGVKELVCNTVTGGDGHPGVVIYQRRGDEICEGSLDFRDKLPGWHDWGFNSTWEEYVPAENVFRVHYDTNAADGEYAVWETRGLADVSFIPYEP